MSNSGGDLDNTVVITGGSDYSQIGNSGDRLKVEGTLNPVSTTNIIWASQLCLNGAVFNMNVNGSVTAQNFTYTPATNFIVTEIVLFLWDNGTTSPTSFGAITALTNGLQCKIRSQGTEYTICNMQNNIDVINYFPTFALITPTSGFMETADLYRGSMRIGPGINLSTATTDYVRFTVRDNLTTLDHLRATVMGYRTI